jgi:hypothetical protein
MEAAKRLRYCHTARSVEQLHLKVFVAFWIQDTQGGEKLEHHKSSQVCQKNWAPWQHFGELWIQRVVQVIEF